jgi:ATP-binding cassette subfamily C protein
MIENYEKNVIKYFKYFFSERTKSFEGFFNDLLDQLQNELESRLYSNEYRELLWDNFTCIKNFNDFLELQEEVPVNINVPIRFSGVAFTYPGEAAPVLSNISFTIKKGQSVAFVGPSGAGKTTVVDLLLGLLRPQRGEILVDEFPLTSQDARPWRRNFGYVPQTIYLSDDTVRNNIAFGHTQDEIESTRMDAVVIQAQLSDVLARLSQGLDTVVGDRGARLSGGQRQRIGIARALYRDPPILVLDEATSALDNETEKEITLAIRNLSGEKTVVLIAHRLSTVVHCDQIVFLVDGTVRACGTYEELTRGCDEFRRFATATAT